MKVTVLMSVCNGERFIKQQIESVLNQTNIDVKLLIRDDGSTDGSEKAVKGFNDGRIEFYKGKNIGAKRSFFDLIEKCGESDFYAFCDQDDFWLPEKLERAVGFLKKSEREALYFSERIIADKDLNRLGVSRSKPRLCFGAAMAKNYAAGCTVVFNKRLMERLKGICCDKISMHDTWIYRAAFAIGADVFYDSEAYILYRQHEGNAIGERADFLSRIKRYFMGIKRGELFLRADEAELLLKYYGNIMSEENRRLAKDIVDYKKGLGRIKLMLGGRLKTGELLTDLVVKAALLTGVF